MLVGLMHVAPPQHRTVIRLLSVTGLQCLMAFWPCSDVDMQTGFHACCSCPAAVLSTVAAVGGVLLFVCHQQ